MYILRVCKEQLVGVDRDLRQSSNYSIVRDVIGRAYSNYLLSGQQSAGGRGGGEWEPTRSLVFDVSSRMEGRAYKE